MNEILRVFKLALTRLVTSYTSGDIDLLDFHIAFRELLKKAYLTMAIAGNAPDGADKIPSWVFLRTATPLRVQYQYLARFMREIRDGRIRPEAILNRALLYINSAKQMWWKGQTRFVLPAYPGDGSTPCLTNCACSWDIQELYGADGEVVAISARWVLGPTEHCSTCVERAALWNPILIRGTSDV